MAPERIYKVTITMGDKKRVAMVKASSASQATRHMLKGMVEVKPASSTQVAEHMEKGGTIQNTHTEPVVEAAAEAQV